jgi:hypothetical protein
MISYHRHTELLSKIIHTTFTYLNRKRSWIHGLGRALSIERGTGLGQLDGARWWENCLFWLACARDFELKLDSVGLKIHINDILKHD